MAGVPKKKQVEKKGEAPAKKAPGKTAGGLRPLGPVIDEAIDEGIAVAKKIKDEVEDPIPESIPLRGPFPNLIAKVTYYPKGTATPKSQYYAAKTLSTDGQQYLDSESNKAWNAAKDLADYTYTFYPKRPFDVWQRDHLDARLGGCVMPALYWDDPFDAKYSQNGYLVAIVVIDGTATLPNLALDRKLSARVAYRMFKRYMR